MTSSPSLTTASRLNPRGSRPGSPRLTPRGSRPGSPRLHRTDISQLLVAANPINSLATKQFQENLAREISESQDLLESHIVALEKQLDEYESLSPCGDKMDPSLQLGHVLYDLEQLKILTQSV